MMSRKALNSILSGIKTRLNYQGHQYPWVTLTNDLGIKAVAPVMKVTILKVLSLLECQRTFAEEKSVKFKC